MREGTVDYDEGLRWSISDKDIFCISYNCKL